MPICILYLTSFNNLTKPGSKFNLSTPSSVLFSKFSFNLSLLVNSISFDHEIILSSSNSVIVLFKEVYIFCISFYSSLSKHDDDNVCILSIAICVLSSNPLAQYIDPATGG